MGTEMTFHVLILDSGNVYTPSYVAITEETDEEDGVSFSAIPDGAILVKDSLLYFRVLKYYRVPSPSGCPVPHLNVGS